MEQSGHVEEAVRYLSSITNGDLSEAPAEERLSCVLRAVQTLIEAAQASEVSSHVQEPEKRGLSERPYEVLRMRHLGMSTREIQRKLWITEATVRSHDRTITAWYGAKTYAEAIEIARQRGEV